MPITTIPDSETSRRSPLSNLPSTVYATLIPGSCHHRPTCQHKPQIMTVALHRVADELRWVSLIEDSQELVLYEDCTMVAKAHPSSVSLYDDHGTPFLRVCDTPEDYDFEMLAMCTAQNGAALTFQEFWLTKIDERFLRCWRHRPRITAVVSADAHPSVGLAQGA